MVILIIELNNRKKVNVENIFQTFFYYNIFQYEENIFKKTMMHLNTEYISIKAIFNIMFFIF